VRVLAPFGTPSRLGQLRGTQEPSAAFDVHAWQSGTTTTVGPFSIACEAVHHPVPAYAMRIVGPREDGSGDAVLAYSGDSDACEGLARVAADADVFVCEATYLTGRVAEPGTHLTARRAAETAEGARVGRLVLTHVPPWTDPNDTFAEAREVFAGNMELAVPGLLLEL
jgi:ribonuclease BN (tRNA processing enzyme)